VNRLTHPLVSAADAARSESCVEERADRLLEVLFDAHRRGSDHWAREGYDDLSNRHRPRVVRVLVEAAQAGDPRPLHDYVRAFSSNARALGQLLRDLATLFTYDETLRAALPSVWREVMATALDALDAGADLLSDHYWSDDARAGLLPTPQLDIGDKDPDTTLDQARASWVSPDEIADLVIRWLPVARRDPKAVDAVVQLARCAAFAWQATTGLDWIEELIDGRHDMVAGRCWYLPDWLEAIRSTGDLNAEAMSKWRRIVDGLAAAGDSRSVTLQQLEE
jgi:hypothetical protein